MRKKLGLFVIVGILMNVGVASADRGFWFHLSSASWETFFNVQNMGSDQTATVTFYDEAGGLIGATSTTLASNANWNFSTSSIGSILATTLEAGTRGVAIISGTTAGEIRGHISIFSNTTATQSGFQMRIHTGPSDDANYDW